MHVFHSVYPYEKLTINIQQMKSPIKHGRRSMSSPVDTSLKTMERRVTKAIHLLGEEKCAIDFSDARRPRKLRVLPFIPRIPNSAGPLDGAVKAQRPPFSRLLMGGIFMLPSADSSLFK
ncbi:hypothetical protein CEXT_307951 [Caerostris extrusa]|uniref:Uncharacterized protein n=1 Tax=Caerostris extrusa TaxID=172846 RepID=A0AAV4VVC7_CAEEX|nr:hypothetical protein CEXT_307951 [Caerostris extrusa]